MCMVSLYMLAILCCHTIDWDIFLRYWCLSQIYYYYYYQDLVEKLSKCSGGILINNDKYNVFCYADDLILTSLSVTGLQELIDTANSYITEHGLKFNPTKTICTTLGCRNFEDTPQWHLNNTILKEEAAVTYLGHISLKISKVIGIMYRIKSILQANILLTMYNALIMPHFNYCLLAWGSNIKAGHKLHLLQKKALRIIDSSHYIAHTEPICKKLQVVKLTDMFRISAWKFYYKLSNNLLPSYFNYMKPSLPVICNYYGIRNPKFHLPPIKHAFAEQMIQYCLIKLLNNDIDASHIVNCIHQHTFCKFKSGLKYGTIDKYSDKCEILECTTCEFINR